jgi:hypothetical protein
MQLLQYYNKFMFNTMYIANYLNITNCVLKVICSIINLSTELYKKSDKNDFADFYATGWRQTTCAENCRDISTP